MSSIPLKSGMTPHQVMVDQVKSCKVTHQMNESSQHFWRNSSLGKERIDFYQGSIKRSTLMVKKTWLGHPCSSSWWRESSSSFRTARLIPQLRDGRPASSNQQFLVYGWIPSKHFFKSYGWVISFCVHENLEFWKKNSVSTNLWVWEVAGWCGNRPTRQRHLNSVVWILVCDPKRTTACNGRSLISTQLAWRDSGYQIQIISPWNQHLLPEVQCETRPAFSCFFSTSFRTDPPTEQPVFSASSEEKWVGGRVVRFQKTWVVLQLANSQRKIHLSESPQPLVFDISDSPLLQGSSMFRHSHHASNLGCGLGSGSPQEYTSGHCSEKLTRLSVHFTM